MKHYMLRAMLALAALALGLIPLVANGQEAAFKAQLTPYAAQEGVTSLSGNGTHVGLCEAEAVHSPKSKVWEKWGTMTLTAADGDLLFLDYRFAFDETALAWFGTYSISGGTGRFADAGGTGDLTVVINYTSPPTWVLDGSITF